MLWPTPEFDFCLKAVGTCKGQCLGNKRDEVSAIEIELEADLLVMDPVKQENKRKGIFCMQ